MDIKEEQHLSKTLKEYLALAIPKYRRGVEQHGGKLWEKSGLIDQAIDENIDQMYYLMEIKHQLDELGIKLGKLKDKDENI